MDKKFARTDRPAPADGHTPDILHALLSPVGAHRLPDSLPGAPAPRAYHGGGRAVATAPVPTRPQPHPEVAMSEPTTKRRPLAISDRPAPAGSDDGGAEGSPAAVTLLKPVPLAPLADPAPARGRARVPRMREPEGMKVDLLGVWHARDRQVPLPAVIWEEMTAAHPELFDEDGHDAAA